MWLMMSIWTASQTHPHAIIRSRILVSNTQWRHSSYSEELITGPGTQTKVGFEVESLREKEAEESKTLGVQEK